MIIFTNEKYKIVDHFYYLKLYNTNNEVFTLDFAPLPKDDSYCLNIKNIRFSWWKLPSRIFIQEMKDSKLKNRIYFETEDQAEEFASNYLEEHKQFTRFSVEKYDSSDESARSNICLTYNTKYGISLLMGDAYSVSDFKNLTSNEVLKKI